MGGGIYLKNADLVLRETSITGNKAAVKGGGVYVEQDDVGDFAAHRVYLRSSNITKNSGGEYGGGVYLANQQLSYEDNSSVINKNWANSNDNINRFPR